MKKHDLPAMPFYFGDWRKCPEVQALEREDRMVWFDMLGYMWESTERGYLTLNKKNIPLNVLARMIGIDEKKLEISLKKMEKINLFSRRNSDNSIYCRRMVRDETIRKSKSCAGKTGMKNRYNKKAKSVITKHITNTETENESENEKKEVIKKIKYYNSEHVLLTEIEYNKLLDEFGDEFVMACIQKLDNYIGSKGKQYKSHYRAILLWVVDALKSAGYKPVSKKQVEEKERLIREQKEHARKIAEQDEDLEPFDIGKIVDSIKSVGG